MQNAGYRKLPELRLCERRVFGESQLTDYGSFTRHTRRRRSGGARSHGICRKHTGRRKRPHQQTAPVTGGSPPQGWVRRADDEPGAGSDGSAGTPRSHRHIFLESSAALSPSPDSRSEHRWALTHNRASAQTPCGPAAANDAGGDSPLGGVGATARLGGWYRGTGQVQGKHPPRIHCDSR